MGWISLKVFLDDQTIQICYVTTPPNPQPPNPPTPQKKIKKIKIKRHQSYTNQSYFIHKFIKAAWSDFFALTVSNNFSYKPIML